MVEGHVSKTPNGDTLRVREVWDDNLEAEMELIQNIIEDYPFLAMDTEFPGVVVKPVGEFKTIGEVQYHTIRTNVDMLKIIQLGLTFSDVNGDLPRHNGELCVWQFNFSEFNLENDMYAPESIKLLLDSGIDFVKNRERGVNQHRFAELLMTSGVVLNEDIHWLTFHSGYDFGYLLKLMSGDSLPATAAEFDSRLRLYFPRIWDMKYIMSKKNVHGGLAKVATMLGVDRIGPSHQAGSDSLLTSAVFMKLIQTHLNGIDEAKQYLGVLYQLGEDGSRPLQNGRANES